MLLTATRGTVCRRVVSSFPSRPLQHLHHPGFSLWFFPSCSISTMSAAAASSVVPEPPLCAETPHVHVGVGGDERPDCFHWLRNKEDPAVIEYLEAENQYCEATLEKTAFPALKDKVYEELMGRIKHTDETVPYRDGAWEYFSRTEEGKQYRTYCRQPAGCGPAVDESAAQVLLDLNVVAEGREYCQLGDMKSSPGHDRFAVALDFDGGEKYDVFVIDAPPDGTVGGAGATVPDKPLVVDTDGSVRWGRHDGKEYLFYLTLDATMRPWQIWRIPVDAINDDGSSSDAAASSEASSEASSSDAAASSEASSAVSGAELVMEEPDGRFYLSIALSQDGKFLVISSDSKVTSEMWLLPADRCCAPPSMVLPRVQGREYGLWLHTMADDKAAAVFMLDNGEGAVNFRLSAASLLPPGVASVAEWIQQWDAAACQHLGEQSQWQELVPECRTTKLNSLLPLRDHVVLSQRREGLVQFQVMPISSSSSSFPYDFSAMLEASSFVAFPEASYEAYFGTNYQYDTDSFRLGYNSFIRPDTVYDYDIPSGELLVRKVKEIPGFQPDRYVVERIQVPSHDGVSVPISLFYRPDRRRSIEEGDGKALEGGDGKASGEGDGKASGEGAAGAASPLAPAPCLLYGYGSYGISYDASFDSPGISLADRGFVVAIAHIRGGGDLGRYWYEDGKMMTKKNTFLDFIAAGQGLVNLGYTSVNQLAIYGASAGGLLIGAVLNMAGADLCEVAIARVPFVDCVSTLEDPNLPLTLIEYEEWGNINEPEPYEYIKSYCPYDNISADSSYPHVLLKAGLNDPRVSYWEPAKFCAKMRRLPQDRVKSVILKTAMGHGHFGSSGRYDYLKEKAFEMAYVLTMLGYKE